jgi:hypothetical protein
MNEHVFLSLFDSYTMFEVSIAVKSLPCCLSSAALIPPLLPARHVSTPTRRGGSMEPLSSAIAHAAEFRLEAAPSSAVAAADLNSPADTTGQMQI